MQETIIENSYSALDGRWAAAGVLSDSGLAVVVLKANGANWDHIIFYSNDAGATWTEALTIKTNTLDKYFGKWIGDSLYWVYGDYDTINQPILLYRVDYNTVTQGFTLALNGVTVRSAVSNTYVGICDVSKEPGGRLWCSYGYFVSSNNIRVSYSDNNGSTWAESTMNEACGTFGYDHLIPINLCTLEKNTVLVFGDYRPSGLLTGAKYRKHLHTDSVDTWAAAVNIKEVSTNTPAPYCKATVVTADPAKKIYGVVVDRFTNPKGSYWFRGTEDSGGAITWGVSNVLNPPSGESVQVIPSGKSDGADYFLVQSGSLTTMRRRGVADSESAGQNWPAETTWALSNGLTNFNRFHPTDKITAALGARYFVLFGTGTAGSYRPYVLRENLLASGNFAANRIIPLVYRTQVQADRVIPVLYVGLKEFNRVIPVHYWVTGLIWVNRDIPIAYRAGFSADRIIPVYYQINPVAVFDRTIPLLYVATRGIDRVIPIYYRQFEEWKREIDAEADVFLAEIAAEVAEWIAEEQSGGTWS